MRRLYGLLSVIGMLALAGSILGYVRNASITSVFGLSGDSDAYFVAIFLPNTLQAVLVIGALAPALVHVYVNYVEQGKRDDARITFSSIVNLIVLAAAALILLGIVFSRFLVSAIAPGLPEETERASADLMRLTLPLLLVLCLAGLIGPVLNTRDHFFSPALNSLLINAFTIGFVLVGGKTMGVAAAAAGILIGGVCHVALLVVFLRKKGIAYSPVIRLRHPGVQQVMRKSAPVVLYMAIAYCAPLLERLLASYEGEGAISIMTIAVTLFTLPTLVFNSSLGIILYPQLVRQAASLRSEFERTLMQASRLIIVVLVPVSILMMAASVPLTRLAYGPGEVSSSDVQMGAGVLTAYLFALTFTGLTQLLQKGIYADGDFVTPLKVEVATLGVYAVAAFALGHVLSLTGLGMARAGHHILVMLLTFRLVRRVREAPSLRSLGAFAVRPLLAALLMAAFYGICHFSLRLVDPAPAYVVMGVEQALLLSLSAGVYLLCGAALGVREIAALGKLLPLPRVRFLMGTPVSVYSGAIRGSLEGEK